MNFYPKNLGLKKAKVKNKKKREKEQKKYFIDSYENKSGRK